jgi:hypothetical protein
LTDYDKILQQIFDIEIRLDLSPDEKQIFQKNEKCYCCDKPLEEDRLSDHDHFTGAFRGTAHNKCNFTARKDRFLPVFFHNLLNYDAHLFIKNLAKFLEGKS